MILRPRKSDNVQTLLGLIYIDVWLQRLRSGDLSEEEAREEALQIGQIEGTFALGDALDSLPSDEEHSAARLALALAIVARIGTDQLLERGASAP